MNVIKFDIEINKKRFFADKEKTIKEQINNCFQGELDFQGDFVERLKEEWNNIQLEQVKALNSPKFLIGYATSRNIKIFLFEKSNTGLRGKNNIALEVIAFGDLPVDQILNESFSKIQKVNTSLKCNHINDTRIFIFPFDSTTKDIFNYELKVRAELRSPYQVNNNDIFRWVFMLIIASISIILYFNLNNSNLESNKADNNDVLLNIYLSICGSAIFYLITDLVVYFIIPLCKRKNHRKIEINNLSSVVEARTEYVPESVEQLTIPEQ
jgi:hypothetical protein